MDGGTSTVFGHQLGSVPSLPDRAGGNRPATGQAEVVDGAAEGAQSFHCRRHDVFVQAALEEGVVPQTDRNAPVLELHPVGGVDELCGQEADRVRPRVDGSDAPRKPAGGAVTSSAGGVGSHPVLRYRSTVTKNPVFVNDPDASVQATSTVTGPLPEKNCEQ